MPNFKLKIKANKRLQDIIIVASNMEDARSQALSKHPSAEIISVEQKGPGGSVRRKESAYAVPGSSGLAKKIVLTIVVIAIAVGFLVLKSMGKL